jgi:predicted amidohydrolase
MASVFIFSSLTTDKKPKVTIAMAQILYIDGDWLGNFVRFKNAIEETNEKKSRLAVFPK